MTGLAWLLGRIFPWLHVGNFSLVSEMRSPGAFTPITACEISVEKPIPQELCQPTLSHEHIIENFRKDLEGRRDLGNKASTVNRAHVKGLSIWPPPGLKGSLLVKKLVKLTRSKSSLIERDFRN